MSDKKNLKKKQRLQLVLEQMEEELKLSLTKKLSNTKEINVPKHTARMDDIRKQIAKL